MGNCAVLFFFFFSSLGGGNWDVFVLYVSNKKCLFGGANGNFMKFQNSFGLLYVFRFD